MKTIKISFPNNKAEMLSAQLELPLDTNPHNFAIFAHCFTCNKNFMAVSNISRALTQQGIGVLRFDFTGLGNSEGEFSETNFSSNIADLVAAASFLEKSYKSPSLLIGHSLGGAAVLVARHQIKSTKAVATIGAPSHPEHVTHLFDKNLDEIKANGKALVNIGGRPFEIKQQFIEDLESINSKNYIGSLDAGLLILHSPNDTIVGIENATQIFKAAKHPRSFISLDGADHILSKKEDSVFAGSLIASWAKRYLDLPEEKVLHTSSQVVTRTSNDGFTTDVKSGNHYQTADEPEEVGGKDFGPTPYHYLLAALGSCTSMTLRMYADRKKIPLDEVKVHLSHEKSYLEDCKNCETDKSKIDKIERVIELEGKLKPEEKEKLLEIADKCPVHRTLHNQIVVNTTLKE
ncbi:bifunctional alpha/beta hydrolase/OsmC family protein [Flexithrix dorotheae]|uniref:bifunctional alpha/beta hydrolase/OsmC family protein n=1 Tax=Flexithrix dorotheae TaxID=70993 RepID=UPI000370B505|nr:bifunctional alpha/beta hydrolase/OsmC family protein [Flexithrix dorotheae]